MAIVISRDMVLGDAALAVPLGYPRFFYESFFRTGTVTASSEESDEFASENATLDPATWNFWRPNILPATLEVELSVAAPANYCLFVAHTLGTDGAAVDIAYLDEDGSPETWTSLAAAIPGSDDVFVILFDETTSRFWRVTVSGSTIPSIGVVMLGKALAMPRGTTLDHGPITLQGRTVIEPNVSEGGQYLGRSIRREGHGTEIAFRHLEATFIRDEFQALIDHARTKPFGWAWAPEDFPAEVAYCWTSDDIRPRHSGLQDRMDVAFGVDGLLE